MALLIFKEWHRNANKPQTPASNARNIRYIGERVHVLKDEGADNGLFGKINGTYFNDLPTKEVCNRIYKLSKQGITMFRSVISFTPERAELLELGTDKARWENYVKSNIRTIAEKNGIDVTGLEWAAAVHLKRGQPHVHMDFWDTKQKIGVNYVNPELCNDIRKKLEIDSFAEVAEDMALLDEEEDSAYIIDNMDEARRALITRTFSNEKNALHEAQNETLAAYKDGGRNIIGDLPADSELITAFERLAEIVPQHGQLKYGYMPDDVKVEISNFVEMLLDTFPELRELNDEYVKLKEDEAKMYHSEETAVGKYNIKTAVGKAKDKLERDMGNIVLREVKRYNFEHRVNAQRDTAPQHTVGTAIAILDYATRLVRTSRANAPTIRHIPHVDLSKDAKRELRNKYRDKEAPEQRET